MNGDRAPFLSFIGEVEYEGPESRAGFPRLVGPSDWDCFLSVKSVDRIELTREPAQATAAGVALARLER